MKIVFLLWSAAVLVDLGFGIRAFIKNRRQDVQKEVVRIGMVILLLLLLGAGVLKGFSRYGLFIGILVFQIILNGIALFKKKEKPFGRASLIGAFIGNCILYGVSLTSAVMFPQYKEPVVTGNYEVAVSEYTWEDKSRIETYTDTGENRRLTVKLWYPKETGSYPLIVFSHGAFGVIDSNYSTCKELASNGYVVASIGHPYHAMFVEETDGNMIFVNQRFLNQVYENGGTDNAESERIVYENSLEWMKIRTDDENFVLDTILEKTKTVQEPFDRIDAEKIGLFGHSMGGASSVALGRMRNDIDAVIDLEGTMFGEYVDFRDGREVYNEEPYPVPLLDVNSEVVDTKAHSLQELGVEYVNFYVGRNALDYEYVVIEDLGHLNFTDLPLVSPILAKMLGVGSADPKECIEKINAMVLDFFDRKLKSLI